MNKSDASLSSATDASGNTESTDAVDSGDMQVTPGDNQKYQLDKIDRKSSTSSFAGNGI